MEFWKWYYEIYYNYLTRLKMDRNKVEFLISNKKKKDKYVKTNK